MVPSITVIVPVYNRANIVLETLQSVATQTVRPTHLVVVDDGSTDDTAARVMEWLKTQHGQFDSRLLCQPNRGVAAARNLGLAAAGDCELVAFLDSDDRWPNDFLKRTTAALSGRPTAVAATCDRASYSTPSDEPSVENLAPLAVAPILWMLKNGAGIASATLFRTAAIRRRGGFPDLQTGEDSALFLRVSLDGPWLHVPGRPVSFNRGLSHGAEVEGNLSHKFFDSYRRWALVYEEFFIRGGGDRVLAPRVYRRLLGTAWYRAGRELARLGCFADAQQCYGAALAWNRLSYKTWRGLAQAFVAARSRNVDDQRAQTAPPVFRQQFQGASNISCHSTAT